jgi:RHS repeat-associated protein
MYISPSHTHKNRPLTHSAYRYAFQGQEKDDEIKGEGNSVNYTHRMYDTRLGRFLSIDPLTGQFPFYSPYHFSSNSPIITIELEGKQSGIRLNYTEGSVELYKEGGSDMYIIYTDQIDKIRDYSGSIYTVAFYATAKGDEYINVLCIYCAVKNSTIRIKLPTSSVIMKKIIQVEKQVVIKGDVSEKNIDASYSSEFDFETDDKSPEALKSYLVQGLNKAISAASKEKGYQGATSITITYYGGVKEEAAMTTMYKNMIEELDLDDEITVKVVRVDNPGAGSGTYITGSSIDPTYDKYNDYFSYVIGYDKVVKTVTPDKTVTVVEDVEVEVVVPAVEIIE